MNLEAYIRGFIKPDLSLIEGLESEYDSRQDIQPSVGREAGRLLGLLVRLMRAQRVLEFGTCLGYSTLWLANAARSTGGTVTAVEFSRDLCDATHKNLREAGLDGFVRLIHGDASAVAEELSGPFDLILQDSAKPLYLEMLERCISLARPGGLLIADDTLFKPMGIPEKFSEPMHRYNELVFAHPRLYSSILPIGDGMTISVVLESEKENALT